MSQRGNQGPCSGITAGTKEDPITGTRHNKFTRRVSGQSPLKREIKCKYAFIDFKKTHKTTLSRVKLQCISMNG